MTEGRTLSEHHVYEGSFLRVALQDVLLPNGHRTERLIRHPGAAAIVPVDASGHTMLVRQYRHATAGFILEVAAGKLDAGEAPERCAARELTEETGLIAGTMTPLGWIWTTPGFTDEKIWLYLATDVREGRQALESNEVLSVVRMPLREAVRMALEGEITDAKSVCALLRAQAKWERRDG